MKEKEPKLEKTRSKTSPDSTEAEEIKEVEVPKVTEAPTEIKKEETKPERPIEQFRKFDPSSPAKPTPKHLQRHMRNESMRFPSGDFSNVTITPRKSITTETTEVKQSIETKIETHVKDLMSQKEIDSARVEEKIEDGEKSPDLVMEEEKDVAEATLRDKIHVFETKMSREPSLETSKIPIKLTKEALKKHTLEQDQGIEYTQEFVREQSRMSTIETQKITVHTEKQVESVKSVKETIQQFDSKIKQEEKSKTFPKTMRTDSTLVQVSSEEDSEFLKKSTDSETETESQTTVKVEKERLKSKMESEKFTLHKISDTYEPKDDKDADKKSDDDDKKDDQAVAIKEHKIEKQLTEELRTKVSEEEIAETLEEKDVSVSEKLKDKVRKAEMYGIP